jgi:hypothetical protein
MVQPRLASFFVCIGVRNQGLNSDFALARQALYKLSHASSPGSVGS